MKVLVTGVFDLLHVEHIRFLAAAKNQIRNSKFDPPAGGRNSGENYLIVGIESDKRVRELKGANRPIIPENERLELVKAIKLVDEAFIVRCETHYHRECRAKLGNQNCLANIKREKATTDMLECYKKLLQEVGPDVYAVSENSPHLETKKMLCREAGVELKVVWPENAEVSTSKIIDRIATSLRSSQ